MATPSTLLTPSPTTSTSSSTPTPPSTTNVRYLSAFFRALSMVGMYVLNLVLSWGTDKDPSTDIIAYLSSPPTSYITNYSKLTDSSGGSPGMEWRSLFTPEEQATIRGNMQLGIPLLVKCIKLACKDVEEYEDEAWNCDGFSLENRVGQIGRDWKDATENQQEMDESQFEDKMEKLRHLFTDTLTVTHSLYKSGTPTVDQLNKELQKVKDELDVILKSTTSTGATSPSTAAAAFSITSKDYTLKLMLNMWESATDVMNLIFKLGKPRKPLDVDLITYLNTLPKDPSGPNYPNLTEKQKKSKFDTTQKKIIEKDKSCTNFDISLLFLCIKLACTGVAEEDDSVWYNKKGTGLESLLYKIKEFRNDVIHENPSITASDFYSKEGELRSLLKDTLEAAQTRYNSHFTKEQLEEEIKKLSDNFAAVRKKTTDLNILLSDHGPALLQTFIGKASGDVKKTLENFTWFRPCPFSTDMKMNMPIQNIFIKVKLVKRVSESEPEVDYTDLLTLARDGSSKRQVLLVEGPAGSGKTTLLRQIMDEWVKGGPFSIKGLDKYQILLRIQCRDTHLESFHDLLKYLMEQIAFKYGDLLPQVLRESFLLVLIDGVDERNNNSTKLLECILPRLQVFSKCTIVCTSRPEEVEWINRKFHDRRYTVTHVELVGIPVDLRTEFACRYHEEIMNVVAKSTPSAAATTCFRNSIDELTEKMEKEKEMEHYRLPFNIVILVMLFIFKPNIVNKLTTQTELYYHTHKIHREKLYDRLFNNDKTRHKKSFVHDVSQWLSEFFKEQLVALAKDQLQPTLAIGAEEKLNRLSTNLKFPEKELLPAFLNTRTELGSTERRIKLYSALHKDYTGFYSAMYVGNAMRPDAGIEINKVIMDTVGDRELDLSKYSTVLKHVPGLFNLIPRLITVENGVAKVVRSIKESGVEDRDTWLDIISNIKMDGTVLQVIAKAFPLPGSPTRTSGAWGEIEVTEGRISSLSQLLPLLQPSTVKIVTDHELPYTLLTALRRHTCTGLLLNHHFQHPDPTHPLSDSTLKQLKASCHKVKLREFSGQVSARMMAKPELNHSTLTQLRLAIASDQQAETVIPELQKLGQLTSLNIHLTAAVSQSAITPLPNISRIYLHLPHVTAGGEDRVTSIVSGLNPPNRNYWKISFPNSDLDEDGWRTIIESVGRERFRVETVITPSLSPPTTDDQLDSLARGWLQGNFKRVDFASDGW